MKNRKFAVVAFLLVAVLALGIGYAALSDTLTIIGNASVSLENANDEFNEDIYFSAGQVVTGNPSKDSVTATNTDDASYAVHSLGAQGDYAVLEFTIQNDSAHTATVVVNSTKLNSTENMTNSNPTMFKVEYSTTVDGAHWGDSTSFDIASGASQNVYVKITVIGTPTTEVGGLFSIELLANAG